jgi:tRNA pseudouridine synthase 10
MAETATRRLRPYEFRTFAVGVALPEGMQEREDEVRSTLRLKGCETAKTQVARLVAGRISEATHRKLDKANPDVSVLVDFGRREATASSKPVFYYGRYTKPPGVAQRRTLCDACRGRRCAECKWTGFKAVPSVEEALRKKIGRLVGSEKMIFTWLGSEDEDSKVFPPGRPFVVEIKGPKKRRLFGKFRTRAGGGIVSVSSGRVLPSKPVKIPSFRFETRIRATAASKVPPEGISDLKARFHKTAVTFDRPGGRPAIKMVYQVRARARGRALLIDAELDGGLPVKRFVSGELVSPSVSEVLKTEVSCRSFDICRVREIGAFGFAEITWDKEKN